jgi:hypothetical protein
MEIIPHGPSSLFDLLESGNLLYNLFHRFDLNKQCSGLVSSVNLEVRNVNSVSVVRVVGYFTGLLTIGFHKLVLLKVVDKIHFKQRFEPDASAALDAWKPAYDLPVTSVRNLSYGFFLFLFLLHLGTSFVAFFCLPKHLLFSTHANRF